MQSHKEYPTDQQLSMAVKNDIVQQRYADLVISFSKFNRLSDKQQMSWTITVQKIQEAEKSGKLLTIATTHAALALPCTQLDSIEARLSKIEELLKGLTK